MWRDILLVVTVFIAVLTWFGVPPKQIARLTKKGITLERFIESIAFVAIIAVTGGAVYTFFFYRRPIDWGVAAIILYICFLLWEPVIHYYFSSRVLLRRIISTIGWFGAIPGWTILLITWDVSVWRKAVLVSVGFVLGFFTVAIRKYMRRRRAIERENSDKKER